MSESATLDLVDERILNQLQGNSRTAAATLAAVGRVTEGELHERIARLERTGHILGYTIVRGYPDESTRPRMAVLRVQKNQHRNGHDLLRSLRNIPEVVSYDVLESDDTLLVRLHIESQERLEQVRQFLLNQETVTTVDATFTTPTIDLRRNYWLRTAGD